MGSFSLALGLVYEIPQELQTFPRALSVAQLILLLRFYCSAFLFLKENSASCSAEKMRWWCGAHRVFGAGDLCLVVHSPAKSPHFNSWDSEPVFSVCSIRGRLCDCISQGSFLELSVSKVAAWSWVWWFCFLLPLGVGGRWGWQPPSSHRSGPGLPQATAKGLGSRKQGWRYLWFGFLCVLWIAKIWSFPLQSWILSQILWISHRIGFSQHSGWLPEPRQWGKAQNGPGCVQNSLGLPLPGTGQLFHRKSGRYNTLGFPWVAFGFHRT